MRGAEKSKDPHLLEAMKKITNEPPLISPLAARFFTSDSTTTTSRRGHKGQDWGKT
jgi:hypothetical protein